MSQIPQQYPAYYKNKNGLHYHGILEPKRSVDVSLYEFEYGVHFNTRVMTYCTIYPEMITCTAEEFWIAAGKAMEKVQEMLTTVTNATY